MTENNPDRISEVFKLTPERLKEINQRARKRKRQERFEYFLDHSKLGWLLHPEPFEDFYRMLPLPTRLAARRARFLRHFSWFSLVRRRSERIYQLGLGGLVIAPLIGAVILKFSTNPAHEFPLRLGILYFSGLSYVIASALLMWRCPDLIKELCLRPNDSDPDRGRHLAALIEEEILNLQSVRIYPLSAIQLEPNTMKSELAAAMYGSRISPMMNGFGSYGRYLLERAIVEFAGKSGFRVFKEIGSKIPSLSLVKTPSKVFEARTPYLVDLTIREPQRDEIFQPADATERTEAANRGNDTSPTENDLILEWNEVGIETPETVHQDVSIEIKHVRGLHQLYEKGALEELGWIVTRWQNWRRLGSRLTIWLLYFFALGLFATFLTLQTITVWRAMEMSNRILALFR